MTLIANESDGALVRTVLSGKADVFGILVERHLARVHAIVYAQIGMNADVDDVAQDAFIAAYRSLDSLRDPEQFGAWLATIARNGARQRLRRNVREEKARDELREQTMGNVYEAPEDAEHQRIVTEAIDALSEDHREVLLLYYFTGRSAVDIARALGISREAVKKRLQRAREALGRQLAGQADELLRVRIPHAAEARRIALVLAGMSPAWLVAAGGGTVSAAGVLGSGLAAKHVLLVGGALAVLAGAGTLFARNPPPAAPPAVPAVVAAASDPASPAPPQQPGSTPAHAVPEVTGAGSAPEQPGAADLAPESTRPATPPPEFRRKQSTMAGGNAQRTGYYDVAAPLDKPALRWSIPLGRPGNYPGVMPTVAQDGSILADYGRMGENYFARFSPEGALLWKIGPVGGKRSLGTPTILSDGTIVHAFNPTTRLMAAYDPQSGETRWALNGMRVNRRHAAPVVDRNDNIYFSVVGPAGLARVDGHTGQILWPEAEAAAGLRFHANASPTLALDEATLYAGVGPRSDPAYLRTLDDGDPNAGRIIAVNAGDGKLRWTYLPAENLRPSQAFNFDPTWGSPLVGSDATVYVQDAWTGTLLALEDHGTRATERWIYDPRWAGDVLRFEERDDSRCIFETTYNAHDMPRMLATDGTSVYMGSFGYPASVHAVDARTGAIVWRTALDGNPVIGSPTVTPDAVYVLAAGDDEFAGTNALYCLDRTSGAIRWHYPVAGPHGDTGENIGLGPDGTIYVLSSGRSGEHTTLIALR